MQYRGKPNINKGKHVLACFLPSALVDNTLLDLHNSSYPTQPHSLIAKYTVEPQKLELGLLKFPDNSN